MLILDIQTANEFIFGFFVIASIAIFIGSAYTYFTRPFPIIPQPTNETYDEQPDNITDGYTIFRTSYLKKYIAKMELEGKTSNLVMDWYPLTNYVIEIIPCSRCECVRILYLVCKCFDASTIPFYKHLEIQNITNTCFMKLTLQQQKYIGLAE